MSKITYEQKIELIERYKSRPMAMSDPDVFTAIKVDVIKANSKGVRKGSDGVPERQDNSLYNSCFGVYREFLKGRDSHLDMTGKKAIFYSQAMKGIINFMRDFMKSNSKPHTDEHVLVAMQFLFNQENWNRLNDYHRNRIKLPDIYENIEEILPMIKNGYDKRTSGKNNLDNLESRIKNKRYEAGAAEA